MRKLNNNIKNLRWVNQHENSLNTDRCENSKSEYYGVYFAYNNKWRAQIFYNKKHIHIGIFNTEITAAKKINEFIINNNLDRKLNVIK